MAKLIGTGANQVPTNADLGKLAYQDAIANGTGTAGQLLQSGGATGSPAWATVSSSPPVPIFPSDWTSPNNTYSTSGTWSKGSLADTDLVWIYMVGGGNAGSADNQIGWNTTGGSGGMAMLLFGQAKVFDGGTYAIGAGQIFGGSTGGNTTFTLSSTYGSRVFSSNENTFAGFHNNPFVYVDGSGIATQSIETGSVTAGLANPAIFTLSPASSAPSWSGHVGNGTIRWNYASGSGASSIFGGGAGGGHSHTNDSSPAANATTRGSSLYAGDGGASASGAAGTYPGGGGGGYATNGGSPSGGNGANGNLRVYHV